jgi:hypothetical protein
LKAIYVPEATGLENGRGPLVVTGANNSIVKPTNALSWGRQPAAFTKLIELTHLLFEAPRLHPLSDSLAEIISHKTIIDTYKRKAIFSRKKSVSALISWELSGAKFYRTSVRRALNAARIKRIRPTADCNASTDVMKVLLD